MNEDRRDLQAARSGERVVPYEPGLARPEDRADGTREQPAPAVVAMMTTEHFVLAGARAATISESNGRASVFLGALSGGLIALSFIGQASHLGAAFYAFGLIVLPALAFVGLTTFLRVFQLGLEDVHCAQRIARLRGFYFDAAPEIEQYLLSVPPEERLEVQGLRASPAQKYLTMSGTVAVLTAALAGSAAGLLGAVISGHSPWAAFPAGVGVAAVTITVLNHYLDNEIKAASQRMLLDGRTPDAADAGGSHARRRRGSEPDPV